MSDESRPANQGRQTALQQELRELADVVAPGPLVDLLLERAFEIGSTDVHFDPRPDGLHVRLRVDGMLHDVLTLSNESAPQVISRLKLLSGMDITERRMCQDGHISSAALKHRRDVRVGSGPTIHGERIVLRLMPDDTQYTQLEELGLESEQLDILKRALQAPYGMCLSVGPVGSGKSTTTYACLTRLNDPGRSLVTIEDPVERRMDSITQIQTDAKIGFGFAQSLRGILRQDPDVILVGEIRDSETAHIAARAALTGTQVLSTLHANDTSATVDLFREFDVPPMFIADGLNCVLAQRLMRKVCPESRETYHPDAAECQLLGIDPAEADNVELVRGVPSDANFFTGYSGRTAIFEIMNVDEHIREAILSGKSGKELREIACNNGMNRLEQSAAAKVRRGETSIAEMHRVLIAP
ncbi:MAG: type II/IV secretion system protein [Planctomycetota bacterium]|nr:MAG: type II/IV secretion system protein [Planctomycetota bacterium]REJ96422.1 MAG: type II/IV secretion system protein [Planctomycetota bacterium]REK29693.1 MAG: type II/IV secretion system protein [Planctomycetota bacterium]REK30486.1 MAG: type II/IV secretion system protein [Planctomycetota bacterium]